MYDMITVNNTFIDTHALSHRDSFPSAPPRRLTSPDHTDVVGKKWNIIVVLKERFGKQ